MMPSPLTTALFSMLCLVLLAEAPVSVGASGLQQSGGGPHGYFKRLVARPDHLVSYSLRDPAQLSPRANGGYTQSNTRGVAVTYAPATDTYPRKQDAAKVVIPADGNNLRNQVRVPLKHKGGGFLVTWDAWWGEEFAFERSGIEDYKAFQLESGGSIWTEIRARFRRAARFPGAVALIDVRPYKGSAEKRGSVVKGTKYGNGSLGGLRVNFPIAANTWTRYWVQLTPREDRMWWDFSLWVSDEKRDATLLYDREAVKPKGDGWDRLWLEYNTSTKAVKPNRGELVSYVRNIVVLKAQQDPSPLFDRPFGTSTQPSPSDVPTGAKAPRKTQP